MKNAMKIIIAIALVFLMIPTMVVVYIKDNQNSPEFCGSCHEDPYYVQWINPDSEYIGAHYHSLMSVSCQMCHQRSLVEGIMETMTYYEEGNKFRLRESTLPNETCFRCHGDYIELASTTADYKIDYQVTEQFLKELAQQEDYDLDEHSNINPHEWPIDSRNIDGVHAEGGTRPSCSRCHKMHRESSGMDYCFTCHHTGTLAPCITCHDDPLGGGY
jgi:hypothetical protein